MSELTLYINPACSNCRNTLQLLEQRGITPKIIEYLQSPLTQDELAQIITLGVAAKDLIRTKEPAWQALGINIDTASDHELIEAIVANPIILQRPIAVHSNKAIISRPPEKIMELL